MKKIFSLILVFICLKGFGQFPNMTNPQSLGSKKTKVTSLGAFDVDSILMSPTGCGSPTLYPAFLGVAIKKVAHYFDSCNHRYWIYDPKLQVWDSAHLGAASGGGTWGTITGTLSDQTDLQTALNLKLNLSDTSTMLSPYLNDVGYGLLRTGQKPYLDSATVFDDLIWSRILENELYSFGGDTIYNPSIWRTFNLNGQENNFFINNVNDFAVNLNTNEFAISGNNGGSNTITIIANDLNQTLRILNAENLNNGEETEIWFYTDSLSINPYQGNINIDSLRNGATYNIDKLMGWGSGNGVVGYVTPGFGINLTSGVLLADSNLLATAYDIDSLGALIGGGADGNGIYTGNGSLSGNTTVTQSTNTLTFNGSTTGNQILSANSSTGTALKGTTTGGGTGVWGETSGNGWGGYFKSATGNGIEADGGTGTAVYAHTSTGLIFSGINTGDRTANLPVFAIEGNWASTNSNETIAQFKRTSSGTVDDNISASIDIMIENLSATTLSNRLTSRLTETTFASRMSELDIDGFNAGTQEVFLRLQHRYIMANNLADTVAYLSDVRAGGGGGGTDLSALDTLPARLSFWDVVQDAGGTSYKAHRQQVYNVKDFGAVGDGVTDDQPAIQRAIDSCASQGGGVVYFPNGIYVLTTAASSIHLNIPVSDVTNTDTSVTVEFRGESAPMMWTNPIVGTGNHLPPLTGVILKSTLLSATAIIGSQFGSGGNMNFTNLIVKNIGFRVRSKTGVTQVAPQGIAIDGSKLAMMTVDNVRIDTESPRDSTVMPATTCIGINFPKVNNWCQILFTNSLITGYYKAIEVGEHFKSNNCELDGNYIGLSTYNETQYHPLEIAEMGFWRNAYHIKLQGTGRLSITHAIFETLTTGSDWFKSIADLDEGNAGGWSGTIGFAKTISFSGPYDLMTRTHFGNSNITTYPFTGMVQKIGYGRGLQQDLDSTTTGQSYMDFKTFDGGFLRIGQTASAFTPYQDLAAGDGQFSSTGGILITSSGGNNIKFSVGGFTKTHVIDAEGFKYSSSTYGAKLGAVSGGYPGVWLGTAADAISAVNFTLLRSNAAEQTILNAVGTTPSIVFEINGDYTNLIKIDNSRRINWGAYNSTASAYLQLPAGLATAGFAPLKLTTGTALGTPEDGAMEYHSSHLYFTIGSTRYQLDQQGGGYTTLSQFVGESNWTTGYINGSGDYTALAIGASGKVLTSNGTSSAPSWETPSGGTVNLSWDATNHEVDVSGGGTSAIIPYATSLVDGLVSANAQSIGGAKTFDDLMIVLDAFSAYSWTGQEKGADEPTPASGSGIVYWKNDGKLYGRNDAGTVYDLTAGGGASTFAALTDVNLTSITTNDFLKWDGTDWINRSPAQVRTDLNVVKSQTVNTTDVGNVTTGQDDLMTYSIPAGLLAANGDYIEFTMTFKFASNANSKQVTVQYGAASFYASSAQAQNDGTMEITGKIIRTGATTQRITFSVNSNTVLFQDKADYSTANETLSGAVILKATGEGVSTDDIIQKILTVKFFPAN